MKSKQVIGIDIGGSHVTACKADLSSMKLIAGTTCRNVVAPGGSPEEILDVLSLTIRKSLGQEVSSSLLLGIAMPGPFDYEQGISYITGLSKYERLYGLNIKELIAERLGIEPHAIRMMNDATAFLQGEICDSPSLLQQRVAGITLGTGLGSAWYEGGQLHDGDLYRLPYLSGMAEDYISTRWFMQQYNGTISGVKELAAKYPHEPQVYELFKTFGEHLAAVLLQKFPPGSRDAIIIGGNIANAWSLFIPHTTTVFEQLGVSMNLLPALKGEQAPVLGAASLWKE